MKNKRMLCFILIVAVILTSCTNTANVNDSDDIIPDGGDSETVTNNVDGQDVKPADKKISEAWDMEMTQYEANIPFILPEFIPDAGDYAVKEDLSDLFNAGQFEGFTENQKKSIYEDGFVILKPDNSVLKMHHIYEYPMYKESPVFITVDSALHLYHIFYDNSLKYVELYFLYDKLYDLSYKMLEKNLEYYNNPEYESLKGEMNFTASYFMTACRLMDVDLKDLNIPSEISSTIEEELALIDAAEEFKQSPILKKDLDYSQYTVRGHYTGNENLKRYFKAMMWYGQCGFPVFDEKSEIPVLDLDNLIKGMIITSITLSDINIFADYENIYSTTALYTGLSDDLGVFEYKDLITKVYGKSPDISIFKDSSYYDKLLEEALLLPEPKIQPKYTKVSTPAGRQFRFMGQRYSFDAEAMQNLIAPQLRPVPSGLDVISSFDNKRAEELLDIYYKPKEKWEEYESTLGYMREKEKSMTDEEWKSDLYNGWLWSIKSSAVSFENTEGMPEFMRSRKWTDKNIHTALGSYAELKHDSILYKKQSGAEMGGGAEISYPYNYVEPNVEVYAKLKWLAENTKENLRIRDMLNESLKEKLDSIIEMQEILMNVSVKELTNQSITEEENLELYRYGGRIDYISQSMYYMLQSAGIEDDDNYTSAIIADISTVAPDNFVPFSQYLEIGNGLPLEIYVVCRTNGKTYLARGALFNYYEFLSDKRLTDFQWHSLLGVKKLGIVYDEQAQKHVAKEIYDDEGELILTEEYDFEQVELREPSPYLPPKPEWTNSFISDEENNVAIKDVELDWPE